MVETVMTITNNDDTYSYVFRERKSLIGTHTSMRRICDDMVFVRNCNLGWGGLTLLRKYIELIL